MAWDRAMNSIRKLAGQRLISYAMKKRNLRFIRCKNVIILTKLIVIFVIMHYPVFAL